MSIGQDLRFAIRLLLKTPQFTAITLLVMVIGLAMFLISYPIAKQMTDEPMPFPDGDRYVSLKSIYASTGSDSGMYNHDQASYNYLNRTTESFQTLGAWHEESFIFSNGESTQQIDGVRITPNLFGPTAVNPELGRVLTADDALPGAASVVVLGYSVWQDTYAADPEIIGKTAEITGEIYDIVGVMPEGFRFPKSASLWAPIALSESTQPGEGRQLTLVGILNQNVSSKQAETELNERMSIFISDNPNNYSERTEAIYPYASVTESSELGLAFLFQMLQMFVLLLAVTNLSSLLFVRSQGRQDELQVRFAVGANRWHLIKQVLLESFLICVAGFSLAIVASVMVLDYFQTQLSFLSDLSPFWYDYALDTESVVLGALVTVMVWLAAGLVTAIRVSRSSVNSIMNNANLASSKELKARFTSIIVVIETILSFGLLVLCGSSAFLVVETIRIDAQVDTNSLLVGRVDLSRSGFESEQERFTYSQELLAEVAEIPALQSVSISTAPIGLGGITGRYELADQDLASGQQLPQQSTAWISQNYFQQIGIELLDGRFFDIGDTADSEQVVIVSDDLANELWPNSSAIGRQIQGNYLRSERQLTIVGVVPKMAQGDLFTPDRPNFYRPISQDTPGYFYIVAKNDSAPVTSQLRQEVALAATRVNRNIPLIGIRSLRDQLMRYQGGLDIAIQIAIGISTATMFLAGIGIFGVLSRAIAQRTREIGIRRAVGSNNKRIVFRFVSRGMGYLLGGIVFGGLPATAASVILWNSSFATSELNNSLMFTAPLILIVMLLLIFMACYLPARRSVAMEPGEALHYE